MDRLFAGWREELATCRKFAPAARGRFGKLHVRHGKGARGSGPRERMVPLINNAGQTLRWFVEDVWGQFGDDHTRPGVPLLPSERKNTDGTASRIGDETLRSALAKAAETYLPDWPDVVTPHVLRHFCASQLYLGGMDLIAIQATLGHAWIATTMQYVHVPEPISRTPGSQVSSVPSPV